MFAKISVLVPTRQRVERLKTMLLSYERTTDGVAAASELIFRIDEDDRASQEFLIGQGHRTVIGPRLQGYRSLPTFFNEMYAVATGDVLMCGNDDVVFQTPRWAPRLLEVANQYPDGLFNLGVTTLNETHHPFCIVSRKAAEHLGFFWDPRIFWGDVFLRDIMAAFGRLVMVPDVHIDHDWVGFQPDQVFREADQNDIYRRDPTYWAGTHAPAVQEAVEKLKELVAA